MCMVLYAYRYILFIRYSISIHKVACVSWPNVIKILGRQLFVNFIYIFSDFIFEIENSVCIKNIPTRLGNQK